MLRLATLFVALAGASASPSAQTYSGRLGAGDGQLGSGEFVDEYSVSVERGEAVRATLTSDAFDTFVIVKSATGAQQEDDDCTEGETTRSCATLVADRTGRVRVLVTSFRPGESGEYQVRIDVAPGETAPPATALGPDDAALQSGELYDSTTIVVAPGEPRRVELRSAAFNTYLIAQGPDGIRQENDDCTQGDTEVSCLTLDVPGEWQLLATSFGPGETGPYTLDDGSARASARSRDGDVRVEDGELSRDDPAAPSGAFSDVYTAVGTGGALVIDLRSSAFDPYLTVEMPGGSRYSSDGHQGARDRSLVVVQTRSGESYRVAVSSAEVGATGAYRLELRDEDAVAAAGIRTETGRLGDGGDRLGDGGDRLGDGRAADRYTFSGVPGQRLRADLTSEAFDTDLVVEPPAGRARRSDGGGRAGHSRIDMDLTEPGFVHRGRDVSRARRGRVPAGARPDRAVRRARLACV